MLDLDADPLSKHQVVYPGRAVDLVALAERHLPLMIAWRNDPAIRTRFFNRRDFTPDAQAAWFHAYAGDPTAIYFAITAKDGRTIGFVGLSKIDWHERSGEFGRFLIGDAAFLGRGFGREAARLALGFAKDELGLTQVELVVFPDNETAINLYRGLGFREAERFPRKTSDGESVMALRMVLSFER